MHTQQEMNIPKQNCLLKDQENVETSQKQFKQGSAKPALTLS